MNADHPETGRLRLDELLVRRGLFASRSRARDAIERGAVTVENGVIAEYRVNMKVTFVLND